MESKKICSKCEKKAIIEIKWKKRSYCKQHFIEYFLGQVKKSLRSKKYGKIEKNIKICVAISGGKDSLSCLHAMKRLGFNIEALHINLGFPGISEKALEICENFCKNIGVKLNVIDLKKEYGFSLPELFEKKLNKATCKICGTVRRYLINKFAIENGFDYIATGHNLSDITAQGINTILSNYFIGFKSLLPVANPIKEFKICGRLKPLFFLTDEENKLYARFNKIHYLKEKCEYGLNSPLNILKKHLKALEEESPGILRRLAFSFISLGKFIEKHKGRSFEICKECGYPSGANICDFCRIVKKAPGAGFSKISNLRELKAH